MSSEEPGAFPVPVVLVGDPSLSGVVHADPPSAALPAVTDASAQVEADEEEQHQSAISLELPRLSIDGGTLKPSEELEDVDADAVSASESADDSAVEADSSLVASLPPKEGSMERDSLEPDDLVRIELSEREEEGEELPENDEDPFEMDDEMSATFCSVQEELRPGQLWRTVILEESEPNSLEDSHLSSSLERTLDSGIVILKDGPGPITQAVSQWLGSAPIQQQLIASTDVLRAEEEEDEEDQEDDDEVEQEEPIKCPAPKNGQANPCAAPSSESSDTDGTQPRVGAALSEASAGRDLGSPEEEELPLSEPVDCDPAKFSVYYQLGVTVEEEEDGEEVQKETNGDVALTDDAILPCPLGEPLGGKEEEPNKLSKTKKKNGGRTKQRHSWRRILLAHRALHGPKNSEDCDAAAATKTAKRPHKGGGQSCCAVQ